MVRALSCSGRSPDVTIPSLVARRAARLAHARRPRVRLEGMTAPDRADAQPRLAGAVVADWSGFIVPREEL